MTVDRRARMLGIGALIGSVLAAVFLFPSSSSRSGADAGIPDSVERTTAAAPALPVTPVGESRFARVQRRRWRSPVTAAATAAGQERCLVQASNFIGLRTAPDGPRPMLKVTEIYGVGDPETGAGDSLIIEGTSDLPYQPLRVWHCAMSPLAPDRVGSPMVAALESWEGVPATWSATHAVHETARVRCLEAAAAAWPGDDPYPEPLINRVGDTLVVTGSFPPPEGEPSRDYRCDAVVGPNGRVAVTVAELSR